MTKTFDSEWVGMIARHLADAADGDRDLESVAARIAAAVPEAQRDEVALVARIARQGRDALDPTALARSPLLGFIELTEGSGAQGIDRARALHLFEAARQDLGAALAAAVDRIGEGAGYALTVGLTFVVIVAVYAIYVLPQFMEMFAGFGAELPSLTRLVIANQPVLVAISVLVLAFGASTKLLERHVRARVIGCRPLDHRLLRLPVAGAVATAYNRALSLSYARVLRGAGATVGAARRQALASTGVPLEGDGSTLATSLAIGDLLGRGDAELDHQFAVAAARLPIAFDAALRRIEFTVKVVLAASIALLVIAMYLPIFKLGSVI